MSYHLNASATDALLGAEEGLAAKKKTSSEKKPLIQQILSWILSIVGWSPIFLILFIPNIRIGITASAGAALFSFCLTGVYYMVGGTKSWPKVTDIAFISIFGVMAIVAWCLPSQEAVRNMVAFMDLIIFGGFSSVMTISWVCFKFPIARQFVIDYVSTEEMTHPSTQYFIKTVTLMYIIGFIIMAGFGAARGALFVTDNLTGTLNIVLQVIMYSILVSMMVLAPVWNDYLDGEKGYKMIVRKFPDEVAAWNAAHPDHEWAQEV